MQWKKSPPSRLILGNDLPAGSHVVLMVPLLIALTKIGMVFILKTDIK